ncbi:MAG: hypothetical protein Q7T21_09680, partial [Gallionella sp.]|nr:hypothetical protein [Gallionella sp.]
LFGGFIIAWLAWNIRAVLVLFSELKYAEKITAWEKLYPNTDAWITSGIVFPLLSAVVFILLYPYPARWIFHYWYSQHKKLKAVQQSIEDEMPLTQAEAIVLRRTAVEDQVAAQKRMSELVAQNREIEERNNTLLSSIAQLEGERDKALNLVSTLEEKLRALEERPEIGSKQELSEMLQGTYSEPTTDSLPISPRGDQQEQSTFDNLIASIDPSVLNQVSARLPVTVDHRVMGVFLAIVAGGGWNLSVSDIVGVTTTNRVDVQYGFDKLERARIIQVYSGSKFELTEIGREAAVELSLTKWLPRLKT